MQKLLRNLAVLFAVALILPACFGSGAQPSDDDSTDANVEADSETAAEPAPPAKKEVPKIFYVSKKTKECESIFFTCPEGRAFFTDSDGCGCRESSEPYNPQSRSMGNMIRDYLARELIKPKCQGGALAEFVYIDEGALPSGDLNYDVWAMVREFCPEGGTGATFDGPVAFDIRQDEFSRVVTGYKTASSKDAAAVKKILTPKAADWVLAAQDPSRDQMIKELQGNLNARLGNLQSQLDHERQAREEAEAAAKAAAEAEQQASAASGDVSADGSEAATGDAVSAEDSSSADTGAGE